MPMEQLPINNNGGQGYGFILYQTELAEFPKEIVMEQVFDRAQVVIVTFILVAFLTVAVFFFVSLANLDLLLKLNDIPWSIAKRKYEWNLIISTADLLNVLKAFTFKFNVKLDIGFKKWARLILIQVIKTEYC